MEKLATRRPADFVNIAEYISGIETDVRYFSGNNFVGSRIEGYDAPIIYLTETAAKALGKAQEMLMTKGYGLRVFDGYRPKRAVEHFRRWQQEPETGLTKAAFYPDYTRQEIFDRGFMDNCLTHMRGSAVDLTVVDLYAGRELDMGSPSLLMDSRADARYSDLTPEQGRNRTMLKYLMLACGFEPAREWWHYKLSGEPYPDTCFDFEIR